MIDQLKQFFGYNAFRPYQEEIIAACMEGRDVVAVLPTGAGKSICYQLPAMMKSGTAIVVSPLISLMQDQVVSLAKSGLSAAFINSSLPASEIREMLESMHLYKLVYIAPERMVSAEFLEKLSSIDVSMFAIDEAHCISQWGHEFRPEYRQLSLLKDKFPRVPIMALTATATRGVENDIVKQLALQRPFVIRSSFNRPNLTIRIEKRNEGKLLEFIKRHKEGSGIVYAATRNGVEETYEQLKREGFSVGKYHAGLSSAERAKAQHEFLYGEVTLMVATVAFGMGIHKPDIRFVVHMDMPRSIEQYYQEIGRAGRDGLPSECLMFYSAEELRIYKLFLEKMEDPALREETQRKTSEMVRLCHSNVCRRREILRYFGETYESLSCGSCDICLRITETIEVTDIAKKILSCVYRMEHRFGITQLIEVLRGQKTMNVMRRGHDRLSTFGLLNELSENEVRSTIEALIQAGLLERYGDYGVIRWTSTAPNALKMDKIYVQKPVRQEEASRPRKTRNGRASVEKTPPGAPTDPLLAKLVELRRTFAAKDNVPAFVVFHDRALREMCAKKPRNEQEFLEIDGVGPVKWKRYGEEFLTLIQNFC